MIHYIMLYYNNYRANCCRHAGVKEKVRLRGGIQAESLRGGGSATVWGTQPHQGLAAHL